MFARLTVATLFALALVSCSSHGQAITPAAPRAPQASGTVTFTIRVPLAAKTGAARPAYVSPNTQSVRFSLTSVNGSAPSPSVPDVVVATTASNPACTNSAGTLSCTFSYTAVIGTDTFTINTYASTDGSGSALSTGTASTNVQIGVANFVSLSLGGVPATLVVSQNRVSAPVDGSVHALTFTVTALDASGATIVSPGSYATPITLTASNDASSALSISPSTIASPGPSGATTVTVNVNTQKSVGATTGVALSAGSASANVATGELFYSPSSLRTMFVGGSAATLSVYEPGYSGVFTLTGANSAVSVSCSPASCAPASTGGTVTFTVTPVSGGGSTFSLSDSSLASVAIAYAVAPAISPTTVSSTGYGHGLYGFGITTDGTGTIYVGGSSPYINAVTVIPCCSGYAINAGASGADITFANPSLLYSNSYSATDTVALAACPSCTGSLLKSSGGPHAVLASDGNLWITTFAQNVLRLTPSGTLTTFPLTTYSNFIASAPDGTLWVSDNSGVTISHFDPRLCSTTCTVTRYTTPTTQNGITVDSNNVVWVALRGQSAVSRITCSTSCTLGTYTVAPTSSNLSWIEGLQHGLVYSYDLANSTHYIFGPSSCDSSTMTCTAIETAHESGGNVYESTQGPDGNLWFVAGTTLKSIALP